MDRLRWRRFLLGAAITLTLLGLPAVLTRDLVTALFFTFTFMTLALNYDLLGGFLGYLNLGQGTFFGLGAYTTFILIKKLPAAAEGAPLLLIGIMAVAVAGTALCGMAVAYPLFRLKGAYFAIATFGLFLLLRQLILNFEGLTGGASGIYLPTGYYIGQRVAYSLALGMAALAALINYLISRSRLGIAFEAIRESERAAAAVGIDLFRHKQLALVIAAIPSAMAGGLFGLNFGYIDLESVLGFDKTLLPVIMAMLGGTGYVMGPILGSAVMRVIDVSLKNYLALPIPAVVIYGLILMGIGLFLPEGILKGLSRHTEVAK